MTSPRLATLAAFISMCTFVLVGCSDKNNKGNGQPQCSDGVDNDGDGMIDFPADPGCTSATDDTEDSTPAAQCMDGRDNDGDGKIDYPEDPGCSAPNQDDETDDCPSGPACPQCSNGKDDDNNGTTDYPNDPGCTSAADPTEVTSDPHACGPTVTIKELPTSGMDSGTFNAAMSSSTNVSPCGEDSGAPAIAYLVKVEMAGSMVATTNLPDTTADTVIDIRSVQCALATSEVACNDDVTTQIFSSTVQTDVVPGTYFVIVKGRTASETGTYALQVNLYKHSGDACVDVAECAPGLTCRIPHGMTAMVCFPPVCSDGLDDDGDTKIDYPDDPGCTSAIDDTEDDDCPSGPNCPACADGVDNDNDGHIDYPADPSCSSASGASEACTGEQDPILTITGPTTMSTMVGMHDDEIYPGSCADFGSASTGGLDRMYTVTVPNLKSLTVDDLAASTPDLILSILPATCSQPSLTCAEGFLTGVAIKTGPISAGTYIVYVDSYSSSTTPAPFDLHVSGELNPGASCEPAATLNGAFACAAAHPCTGAVGSRICMPTQCSDGIDNDGDGKTDYPNDPGCTDVDDNTEGGDGCFPLPVTAACPACSDLLDNDGDGKTDYPMDPSCTSAAGGSESCDGEADPIVVVTMGATPGNETTTHDDRLYEASCSSTLTAQIGGHDTIYQLTIPAVTTLHVGTTGGIDTVSSLFAAGVCTGASIACDDEHGVASLDSLIKTGPLAAGTYFVSVDMWSGSSSLGPYSFNVSGTLATNSSCEPGKTFNGALTCTAPATCLGTAPNRKCM